MAILKNVTLRWSHLGTPVKQYESEDTQWEVDAVVADNVSKEFFKKGLTYKERFFEDDDGKEQAYIKFKRTTHWKKSGDPRTPVIVVDAKKQEIDSGIIGNGTKADLQFNIIDWTFGQKSGKSLELVAVKVTDLVEYKQREALEFEFDEVVEFDDDAPFSLDDEF